MRNIMKLKLNAYIEHYENAGYVGWIENEKFKGMVVQAESAEAAHKELLISLKAKIAYDFGIEMNSIEEINACNIPEDVLPAIYQKGITGIVYFLDHLF